MGVCEETAEDFRELRSYFLGRRRDSFDLDDLCDEIANLARRGRRVTYGQIMRRYRVSRGGPRGIATILGIASERAACQVTGCRDSPHYISTVVVRADTGYPSGGFFGLERIPEELERSERAYGNPSLSAKEKHYVEGLQRHLHECKWS